MDRDEIFRQLRNHLVDFFDVPADKISLEFNCATTSTSTVSMRSI